MANKKVKKWKKLKYGEEGFSTFSIKDISFDKLLQKIKQNCSPLVHQPASNIRVWYRDVDGDMINLSEDPNGFAFGEMLRSGKEVKDREYKKIFLQASEIDSPLLRKMRQTELETPFCSALSITSRLVYSQSIYLSHQHSVRIPPQQQLQNVLGKVLWTASDRECKKIFKL